MNKMIWWNIYTITLWDRQAMLSFIFAFCLLNVINIKVIYNYELKLNTILLQTTNQLQVIQIYYIYLYIEVNFLISHP